MFIEPVLTLKQKVPLKQTKIPNEKTVILFMVLIYLHTHTFILIDINILTFKILDMVNTNIIKSMYIVIYVQDNRTHPKLFLHSYVTLSDPGTVQLINMAYFIHLCPVTLHTLS